MKTELAENFINTADGKKADAILRSCVHCGFCLATCPTYQILGNELDSPRGRIYLIKNILEGKENNKAIKHLDRCLTCLSCETTCPSGVKYHQLLDIGRSTLEKKRNLFSKAVRYGLVKVLTTPFIINNIVRFNPFHTKINNKVIVRKYDTDPNKKKVLLFTGCVQKPLAPSINQKAKQILELLNYEVIETKQQECCGAIEQHLSFNTKAKKRINSNIKNWSKYNIEAIISTASGCGVMLKEYKDLGKKVVDISEFLLNKDLSIFKKNKETVVFHSPCTLQHGQKILGVVEHILQKLNYNLSAVKDSHLCCGSAGTYSILQPSISKQLRDNKIKNLIANNPAVIVTANIGCLMHLQKASKTPVKHWIELLEVN